jgi:ferritin-like metal-binding protein YciE
MVRDACQVRPCPEPFLNTQPDQNTGTISGSDADVNQGNRPAGRLRRRGMKIETLQDALLHELRDIYSAEKQLTKALPKMAKGASNAELAAGFEQHLEETVEHVNRLEGIFKELEVSSKGEKCKGMAGLIEEGSKLLEEEGEPTAIDALLVTAAQRVEHYEIAAYGSAIAFADQLGLKNVSTVLKQTLQEEEATDKKLSDLAESTINPEAANGASASAQG